MAAPHVAGVAALVWQAHVAHPLQATTVILRASTEDIGLAGDDNATGLGILTLRGEASE
jgi:subtilisin family serine protease